MSAYVLQTPQEVSGAALGSPAVPVKPVNDLPQSCRNEYRKEPPPELDIRRASESVVCRADDEGNSCTIRKTKSTWPFTPLPFASRRTFSGKSNQKLTSFASAPEIPLATPTGTSLWQRSAQAGNRTVGIVLQGMHHRPEFWNNLPQISQLFIVMSLLSVALVLALIMCDFSVDHQVCVCGGSYNIPLRNLDRCPPALRGPCRWEPQNIFLSVIVFSLMAHYIGFVFAALRFENVQALQASVFLSACMLAAVLYYTVKESTHSSEFREIAVSLGTITATLQLLLFGLALLSYRQMGWRTYSKCAADVRVKDANKLRVLYLTVNKYTTLVKLDFMMTLLVVMTSCTVWVDIPLSMPGTSSLLANFVLWPVLGFVLNTAWLVLCWLSVRREWFALGRWAARLMPITMAYMVAAVVAVVFVLDRAEERLAERGVSDSRRAEIIGQGRQNLSFLAALTAVLLLTRLMLWWSMRSIITRYGVRRQQQHAGPGLMEMCSTTIAAQAQHRDIHPDILPLTKGAWIGKPSPVNPKKKRFFQLSSDGTTLRWAWNKYILMLYVEDIQENVDNMELTITVTAEPNLVLKFADEAAYKSWTRGFHTLLALLLGPDGLAAAPGDRAGAQSNLWRVTPRRAGSRRGSEDSVSNPRASNPCPARERPPPPDDDRWAGIFPGGLTTVLAGFATSHRASVVDPDATRLEMAKAVARRHLGASQGRAVAGAADTPSAAGTPGITKPDVESLRSQASVLVAGVSPFLDVASTGEASRPGSPTKLAALVGGARSPAGRRLEEGHEEEEGPSTAERASPVLHKAFSFSIGEGGRIAGAGAAARELAFFSPQEGHPLQLPRALGGGGSGCGAGGSALRKAAETARRSTLDAVVSVSINELDPSASITEQLGVAGRVDNVDLDDLQMGKFLGAGAEGAVFAAWYNESPVAVKKTTSVHEVHMHVLAGSHDNIVSARGLMLHEGELHVVMEYCPRGTLDTMIHHTMHKKGSGLGWDPIKVVLPMVRNIARGLLHLHKRSRPILHRDLKPGNIFVSHGLVMKIGDFGMSRQVDGNRQSSNPERVFRRTFSTGVVGTSTYSAPEVLAASNDDDEVDPQTMLKADVYSFGVTLWEILMRKRPFDDMDHFEVQMAWMMNPESMRLPPVKIDSGLSPAGVKVMTTLAALVIDCTQHEPALRPTAKEIVSRIRFLNSTDNNV